MLATSLAFRGRVGFDRRPGLCYRRREDSPGAAALTPVVLLANAGRVRARVRDDPAVAAWAKSLLPLIAAAQWVAARLAYPSFRRLRALLSGRLSSVC